MSTSPIEERRTQRVTPGRAQRVRSSSVTRRTPAVGPTFFSRYECKYLVDPIMLPEIRHYLRPFTRPDAFAAMRKGYRYPICSLYLDSHDLVLYQQTVGGEKDRFKLRVRTYTDDPATPAYFEVKQKVNNVVHKRRAGLSRKHAALVLNQRADQVRGLDPRVRDDINYFNGLVALTGARPVVRIRYVREAYEGDGNEPVRVTIDTELMHAVTLDDRLSHESGRWTTTPLRGVILEIKFTERYPWWVQQFIRAFALKQQAMPKYVLSVDHFLMDGREAALAIGGFVLPPRRV